MSHELHANVDFVRDTSAEALSLFYEIQRKRPVGQKLVDVFDLSEGLFETVKAGFAIRQRTSARCSFARWPAEYHVS
jgi:hypothetical protein